MSNHFNDYDPADRRAIAIAIASTGVRYDFGKFELADKITPVLEKVNPKIIIEGKVVTIHKDSFDEFKKALYNWAITNIMLTPA